MGIFEYEISKTTINEPVQLIMSGDLIGEQLDATFMDEINQFVEDGYLKLIVDLSDLKFISSSGIGILITMLTKVRNRGGEMVLVNPSDKLNQLLAMTKLLAIFKIENTVESADLLLKE